MTLNAPVLIAGGGIGGLVAALALRHAGFDVRVFERATEIGEVGAGLTVQPNAMLALRRIGLDGAVAAAGRTVGPGSLRRWDGKLLSLNDLREVEAELGAPAVAIHRATLQRLLLETLGSGAVETGGEATGYQTGEGEVAVRLRDGRTIVGALLIGADGIRSAVRAQLLGDGEPAYAGYTCWRGVTPEGGPRPEETTETWGPGRRFGVVPIERGRVYWYATLNAPPGGQDEPGRVRETLLRLFTGWHTPIREVLEATPEDAILRNDILHRLPVQKWGEGRVTLLGDAAHPMTPNLGQGACQAIEDAVILADCLKDADPATALRRYEAKRIPRANGFVLTALRLGRVAQWEGGLARAVRDQIFAWTPPSAMKRQLVKSLAFQV
jgi:2-polyprenyl-6-methoxyphenol hydroxylase-like FAD-dependent oxidoreductase